ncbi:hypothetical protein Tsubulata_023321 [Turnera subulata]|uniref:Uncharacterized protein n=1 Tax=Turnera subulata TaxID=218843 RepID=A0A9Q0J7P4_9ROSI|nr:hypothetical protein Tsubulata_023321 [Turnera subulata]
MTINSYSTILLVNPSPPPQIEIPPPSHLSSSSQILALRHSDLSHSLFATQLASSLFDSPSSTSSPSFFSSFLLPPFFEGSEDGFLFVRRGFQGDEVGRLHRHRYQSCPLPPPNAPAFPPSTLQLGAARPPPAPPPKGKMAEMDEAKMEMRLHRVGDRFFLNASTHSASLFSK